MEGIISKELLSKVLGEKVIEMQVLKSPAIFGSKQLWIESENHDCAINIYELAHKCKEWALYKGYSAISWYSNIGEEAVGKALCSLYEPLTMWADDIFTCSAETEPEGIFKACQWILDNKGTK